MLKCGDTFLTGDGDEDDFHLWIIVPPPSEGEVVTVCMVTTTKKTERLVQLIPGITLLSNMIRRFLMGFRRSGPLPTLSLCLKVVRQSSKNPFLPMC